MAETEEKNWFGVHLTSLREARGLSQKELAARVGCGSVQISRYETGRKLPRTPKIYVRLSMALGVSADELLGASAPGTPVDPRLAARLQALGERLAPEQVPVFLAVLDAVLALALGDLRTVTAALGLSEPL